MKFIFIALITANIAFAVMQLFGSGPTKELVPAIKSPEKSQNNLQTLAERNEKTKEAKKSPPKKLPEVASESSTGGDTKQCKLIGPFVELLHAEYLVEQLISLGIAAELKHIEIMDGKNYWVYLKPEMSEKEALRRLYEVQAKSIDSYIIPSGELANGISFGQFSDEKEAKEKVNQIRDQGYAVEIKEIPKSHSEVWVEIKDKSERKISEEKWLELLKDEKDIERRQNYCLGVAN